MGLPCPKEHVRTVVKCYQTADEEDLRKAIRREGLAKRALESTVATDSMASQHLRQSSTETA